MQWTFTSPELYSIVYNGSYMLPNTIIALVIAAFLYQPMKKYILGRTFGKEVVRCPPGMDREDASMGKFDGLLLVSDFDDTLYDFHHRVPPAI